MNRHDQSEEFGGIIGKFYHELSLAEQVQDLEHIMDDFFHEREVGVHYALSLEDLVKMHAICMQLGQEDLTGKQSLQLERAQELLNAHDDVLSILEDTIFEFYSARESDLDCSAYIATMQTICDSIDPEKLEEAQVAIYEDANEIVEANKVAPVLEVPGF